METLFCKLIAYALHKGQGVSFLEEEKEKILQNLPSLIRYGNMNNILSLLYEGLYALGIPLPEEEKRFLAGRVKVSYRKSYAMLSFAERVCALLEREQIPYVLLKGVFVSTLYPSFEQRSSGDVDVYVPVAKDFQRAYELFQKEGFVAQKDFAFHHISMTYTDVMGAYCLELHGKVMDDTSNEKFNRRVNKMFGKVSTTSFAFPETGFVCKTLSPTENAVYLLLHMLQHFISSGFGLKLLCDWTLFLEQYTKEIDKEQFFAKLSHLGLTGFCSMITKMCERFLALETGCASDFIYEPIEEEKLQEFLAEILNAGECGAADQNRMALVLGDGLLGAFRELHRHMKRRFHRLSKIWLLWPVLWLITGVCFVWNNHFVRKVDTRAVLDTAQERKKLADTMHLFKK